MKKIITTLLALVLLGTGCAGVRGELVESGMADEETDIDPTDIEPEMNEDGAIQIGDLALETPFGFTAPELFSGRSVSGAELYANAPMIMTFMSPTCAVCVNEAPELAAAAERNPDITYLVVHGGADTDSYRDFADERGLYQENVIHVEDTAGIIWERFSVISTPTTLMVDLEGRVTKSTGALEIQGQQRAADIVLGQTTT